MTESSPSPTTQELYEAYRKLKNYYYYDNSSIYPCLRIAEFEQDLNQLSTKADFIREFRQKMKKVKNLFTATEEDVDSLFASLLSKVTYKLLPKPMKQETKEKPNICSTFLTNQVSSETIDIGAYNIYIDAPVDIHLIATLWLMKVGVHFVSLISDHNYAYQMTPYLSKDKKTEYAPGGLQLYAPYFKGYQDWRDNAIKKAEELLKKGKNATIVSLDLTRYFYNIRINLLSFVEELSEEKGVVDIVRKGTLGYRLNNLLNKVHKKYSECIANCRPNDVPLIDVEYPLLPVGLISSGIIGNLFLRKFDRKVITNLHPDYYGRYVDDMLFVIGETVMEKDEDVDGLIETYFVNKGLLIDKGKGQKSENKNDINENSKGDEATNTEPGVYELNLKDSNDEKGQEAEQGHADVYHFEIQRRKIAVEHFVHGESLAALKQFKRNIQKKRSEFRLLPDEEIVEKDFDDAAFTMQYKGSVNKLRDIEDFHEDKYGASTYLAHRIFLARHDADGGIDERKQAAQQILAFFKGEVAINFYSLWEKVCSYFMICGDISSLKKFSDQIHYLIHSCSYDDSKNVDILNGIRSALEDYREMAIAKPLSMNLGMKDAEKDFGENVLATARRIRHANMFEHQHLGIDGINLTDTLRDEKRNLYHSSFSDGIGNYLDADHPLILLYPHHIHFEENNLIRFLDTESKYQVKDSMDINGKLLQSIYKSVNDFEGVNKSWTTLFIDNPDNSQPNTKTNVIEIEDPEEKGITSISINDQVNGDVKPNKKVAIANLNVDHKIIENTALDKVDVSQQRRKNLFKIINEAVNEGCNMLVLPELSVPYQWLGLLKMESKRHNLAIVAGLTYMVNKDKVAFNNVVTILPYKTKYYTSCIIIPRVKNHYAPKEQAWLETYQYKIPQQKHSLYHLFHWQQSYFSVYNCFELASIEDRALVKSKVDFVVATELNADTNYYSDIAGAWVRDIHAYFIQVNSADFGDSRIMRPSRTADRDMVIVKGGRNATVLVDYLDIESLRQFQLPGYFGQKENGKFKPTPPEFNTDFAKNRIKDEKIYIGGNKTQPKKEDKKSK